MSENQKLDKKSTRQKKPVFFVYQIKDADGNLIEGADVEVLALTRNSTQAMTILGDNQPALFRTDLIVD